MEIKVTGVMVYYYFVCKRKLWYFANHLAMEQENENVAIGKMIDEGMYLRDNKHINIDNVINIDFIRNKKILHEVKKSNKIEEASVWQVKYYLFYLKQRGVILNGQIDYPLLKQTVHVELSIEDEIELKRILCEIKDIVQMDCFKSREKKNFCNLCAYYDLCFI